MTVSRWIKFGTNRMILESMKTRELGPTQEAVENMAHLMEKYPNIVMPHKSRSFRSWLCQIGHHSKDRIFTPFVRQFVAFDERPYSIV